MSDGKKASKLGIRMTSDGQLQLSKELLEKLEPVKNDIIDVFQKHKLHPREAAVLLDIMGDMVKEKLVSNMVKRLIEATPEEIAQMKARAKAEGLEVDFAVVNGQTGETMAGNPEIGKEVAKKAIQLGLSTQELVDKAKAEGKAVSAGGEA